MQKQKYKELTRHYNKRENKYFKKYKLFFIYILYFLKKLIYSKIIISRKSKKNKNLNLNDRKNCRMNRNSNMPENSSESSSQKNGSHLPSFFEPLISNDSLYQNIFTDVSPFNQHLINNLTTSLFLEHQNVLSKLITDLGLSTSLVAQNLSFLDTNVKSPEKKRKKISYSINDLIQQSNDLPVNLTKPKNGLSSQDLLSKMSPKPNNNLKKENSHLKESKYELGNNEINLIESKLKVPLRFG